MTEITCDIFVCVVGVWQRDFFGPVVCVPGATRRTRHTHHKSKKKHNLSNLPHQTVEKLQKKKKTKGSSEDPSLVNNVDELGLVY